MPLIEEIHSPKFRTSSTGGEDSKIRRENKAIEAVSRIRDGRLRRFYWKMFGASNGSVRARGGTLKMLPKTISGRNPIFRIGESDKFYGFPHGHVKELWTEETLPKKEPEKRSIFKSFFVNLDNYFDKSTLHGLRYIGDSSLTIGERIFWLVSFLTAVSFAAYFINNIYEKYNVNPVIISFSPTSVSISEIPFPAVTICSVNIVKKSEGERILLTGTDTEKLLLDDYCDTNYTVAKDDDDFENIADWNTVKAFILKVTQSCSEMLKLCKWKQREHDCNVIFNPILTDDGYCCTFNRLPSSSIFRNPKELNDLNETYPSQVYDWTPQKGYTKNVPDDALPWRSNGAGAHLGLTVVVDAQLNDYYCQTTNSAGFKIILSNPIETPKMKDFGFFLRPGLEARIVVKPKKIDSTPTLKNIEVDKRQCYFAGERYLQFYRVYTEKNCKQECQANRTLKSCNCVPYFLPKNRTTRICGKKQDSCVSRVKGIMEKPFMMQQCKCLQACFEIAYSKSLSFNTLSVKAKPKDDVIKNESLEYFASNMAILNIYFADSTFTQRIKSEIYGFSEFLSNTGGLLGLFLGFSFLSAVEIGYHILIRIACKLFQDRLNKRKAKRKSATAPIEVLRILQTFLKIWLNLLVFLFAANVLCDCLPGCFEVCYEYSYTGMLTDEHVRPLEDNLRTIEAKYMVENISVFHFYYVTRDFDGLLKSELFGFAEFLSQTGGLLGVFLGFSILSAIEILFHLFLKTPCNKCKRHKPKNDLNSVTSEPTIIKPFTE